MNDWAFLLFNDTTQQLDVVSYFGVTSDYSVCSVFVSMLLTYCWGWFMWFVQMDMNGALGGAQVVFGNDSYIYFIDGTCCVVVLSFAFLAFILAVLICSRVIRLCVRSLHRDHQPTV